MPLTAHAITPGASPRYEDARPVVVIARLAELRGPTAGTVTLPKRLDWGPRPTYDLDDPVRVSSLYRTVLREALSDEDLRGFLDGQTLVGLWSTIVIPQQLRSAWEQQHPELTR